MRWAPSRGRGEVVNDVIGDDDIRRVGREALAGLRADMDAEHLAGRSFAWHAGSYRAIPRHLADGVSDNDDVAGDRGAVGIERSAAITQTEVADDLNALTRVEIDAATVVVVGVVAQDEDIERTSARESGTPVAGSAVTKEAIFVETVADNLGVDRVADQHAGYTVLGQLAPGDQAAARHFRVTDHARRNGTILNTRAGEALLAEPLEAHILDDDTVGRHAEDALRPVCQVAVIIGGVDPASSATCQTGR